MGANDAVATKPVSASFDPVQYLTLLQGGTAAIAEAESLVIDSDLMYHEAGELLKQVKGSKQRIEEAKESMMVPARAMAQAIRNFFDPGITRREAVEKAIKTKMIAYTDKKAAEAEALRKAAEEAARKEKERLEREAAAARARADEEAAAARRKAEEAEAARARAEQEGNARAAAAAAASAAKLREQADQKEQAGARASAELQERAALTSVAVAPSVAAPKVKGTSIKRPWKARIKDKKQLLLAIAANFEAYGHLVSVEEGKLNRMASAQEKGLEAVLPGIECYQDASMSSTAD